MATPNLKLEFRWMRNLDQMPNGYHLATVEQVRNHFDSQDILPLHTQHSIQGRANMRLLDGYMAYPPSYPFAVQQILDTNYSHKVAVKEKVWDENAGAWKTRSSACCSSDGFRLRNTLYHHIPPSPQLRHIALITAIANWDFEVLCWLFTTTSSEELEGFKSPFSVYPFQRNDSLKLMIECLLSSNFPFQLPLREDSYGKTVIHYAIEFVRESKSMASKSELDIYVVDLLAELFSQHIVDWKNSNEMSFIEMAKTEIDEGFIQIAKKKQVDERFSVDEGFKDVAGGFFHIFTKLLFLSSRSLETHLTSFRPVLLKAVERPRFPEGLCEAVERLRFQAVLCEAVERKYGQLTEKLLDFNSEMSIDASSVMLVLRETARKGLFHLMEKFFQKKLELQPTKINIDLAGKDEDEKTLIHYAAESADPRVLGLLVTLFRRGVLQEAEGKRKQGLMEVLMESKDDKGRTPLHIAASKGNKKTLDKQLALLGVDSYEVTKYIKKTDYFGRTALQMASLRGHRDIVKVLVEKGKWDPLNERDVKRKTALHYAAQARDPEDAKAICNYLLKSCKDDSQRSLLLWASASGIGTADEGEGVHPSVKKFLETKKASDKKTNLLREAALLNNVEMSWELLNRGADMDNLLEWDIKADLSVTNVLHQLELLKEQGGDQPSIEDKLGRNVFAEGLAALFLNGFIQSPITVGICGEWGMGKSSLMIQTEKILLVTAAQLTFPNLLKVEEFVGAKTISLSKKGSKIYETIKKGAYSLFDKEEDRSVEDRPQTLGQEEDRTHEILLLKVYHKFKDFVKNLLSLARHRLEREGEDPLVKILQKYDSKYESIYKSLACMDSSQMLDSSKRIKSSQEDHVLRQVPRILTIRYNAWHYHDEHQAWAGLAVTITKEIEKSMTRAQWFSTCWRYNWMNNNANIYIQFILPCFMATFLAGWIAWVFWIVLKQGKFKDLKYGSIPLTLIPIVWTVLKSIMSVVKPVSVQMLGYITSPDHTKQLGYQEQVISDISFLKKELGKRPHWFFSFLLGKWWWSWFDLWADNIENTSIKKFGPASEDQLRIITFVDDLDRCEEKVVLQVLSAVNLVLARCQINVVLGIDKTMIDRAIRRSFEDVEDNDLAEKFLCKIIQIPLSLPDPTEDETKKFVEDQLGHKLQENSSIDDDTDYETDEEGEIITGENDDNEINSAENVDNTVLEIGSPSLSDCSNPSETRSPGLIEKATKWLLYLVKQSKDESSDQKVYPLAFSEGAMLTREMLITNYSEEEARTFDYLRKYATGSQKLPREWKRLLNYHKLAVNILSKIGDIQRLPTWKVELVIWIFVCWEWKHEMNILIKGWSKFARMDGRSRRGPSLSEIVGNCIELGKGENSVERQGNGAAKTGDDFFRVRGCLSEEKLRQEKLVTFYLQGHTEENQFHNGWEKLKEALKVDTYDVSMKGIQLFQQFRLHCYTDHLPWPLND